METSNIGRLIKTTLYGEAKNDTIKVWNVYVNDATVIVEWGLLGGKMQIKETLCKGKNIGKKSETTPEEQAILEAEAKWTKQHDNKLYRETPELAREVGGLLPMLAIDGSKKPKAIIYPCHIQPKLDGVRCTVYIDSNGDVSAISRQGKTYSLHEKLAKELKLVMKACSINKLDGELYIHGVPLPTIVSAVRMPTLPLHHELELHIFDIPVANIPWHDRVLMLQNVKAVTKDIRSKGEELAREAKFVKVVESKKCFNKNELDTYLEEYIQLGYEGIIARNDLGKYNFNHRSVNLIKVKKMLDSEAKVANIKKDKNGEGVLECEWKNTEGNVVIFSCKMKGTHKERLYENSLELVGKWINFKYQTLTPYGMPQFPVGLYVRECDEEGNPLM